MFKRFAIPMVLGVFALSIAGCASSAGTGGGVETRAYIAQKDRVDQKMEGGNFGYINGTPKQPDLSKMSKTRKVYVLEFTKNPDVTSDDLRKPVPPAQPVSIDVPERHESMSQDNAPAYQPITPSSSSVDEAPSATPSEYVIQKNDTLQKISKKVYGTYKKWYQIYEANKDIITDPNRIKPGLTIRIP
ncbi:MAG: LysM peptidoglycan-binding domain-containing protein [Candidatus Omnitrophica bacterium]|nr:LysM peptidoglycan-binding domain-containing protein [Candidatus Omnitrophota bacterium]